MAPHRSRRALLATLGTTVVAGCLGDVDPNAAPVDEGPTGTASTSRPEPTAPERLDTDWPMPGFDPGRSNYTPDARGPTEPIAELWHRSTDAALSAPVVAGGTLSVGGDDGVVRAFDASSGDDRWRTSVDAPAGTPWSVDGDLFVPTDGAVVALDAGGGAERWRIETTDRDAVLVDQRGVYWLSSGEPPVVARHAREDGERLWRTEIGRPCEPPMFAGDGSVFVSSGTHDFRFWRLAVDSGEVVAEAPRAGNDFPAEQFLADSTVYAADSFFGKVRASAVGGGDHGWVQSDLSPGGRDGGALGGGEERVYYTSNTDDGPGLYALSSTDGSVAWTADVAPTITGRPVVASEAVVVPTNEGRRCFAPANGAELWAGQPDEAGDRFAVVDDLVYATTDAGVRALRPP
jgi:outer membrane protein assembly factor BamB